MSKEILNFAIEIEESIKKFYEDAKEKSKDDILKDFFNSMIISKKKYERFLNSYKDRPYSLKVAKTDRDFGVTEEVVSDDIEFSPNMEFKDAVALAMKKEQQLMDTYKVLMEEEEDLSNKDMLRDMANACSNRKASLEEIYNSIAFNEVW
ncbi:MAG: ferritin family protein [Ezakiella sp.]|nr:ferritin family protein [Ezakiella sp.]